MRATPMPWPIGATVTSMSMPAARSRYSRTVRAAPRCRCRRLWSVPAPKACACRCWCAFPTSSPTASHGSFFFDWGTEDEVAWRDNYRRWMSFVNDYKNRGGRVTVGSDSGYIYKIYGFGTIEELELLREAGFHPLEVIRAATLNGAQALGAADRIGSLEPGKLADIAVVKENPLANLKVLYGTGHIRLGNDGKPARVGGVDYTIKDGIVYDAKQLLREVREMVATEKKKRGIEHYAQPGE